MDTGLTLRVDGVAIFTNLATPGFVPATGDRVVLGARTSAFDQQIRLDNLVIFTGGVLSPVSGIAPYYKSSDYPQAGQTADKAFDGDPNTKWLTLDYTGFIGGAFLPRKPCAPTPSSVQRTCPDATWRRGIFRLVTTARSGPSTARRASSFSANRGERRTFVVANPVANTKFRVLDIAEP